MKIPISIILAAIFFLALILRLYRLGQIPPSLNWDEASVGWNGFSLATTGSDEYGKRFPLSIRSFNDYKPPIYTYTTIPIIALLGLSELSVRLPSALAGSVSVLLVYFLVRSLLQLDKPVGSLKIPLITSLLLAVSPWHLQFSRIAF